MLGAILSVLLLLAGWQYALHGKTSKNSESIVNLVKTDEELKKADKNISDEVKRQVQIRDDKFRDMEKKHGDQMTKFREQNYGEHEAIKNKLSELSAQVSRNIGLAEGIQSNIQILIDKNES